MKWAYGKYSTGNLSPSFVERLTLFSSVFLEVSEGRRSSRDAYRKTAHDTVFYITTVIGEGTGVTRFVKKKLGDIFQNGRAFRGTTGQFVEKVRSKLWQ